MKQEPIKVVRIGRQVLMLDNKVAKRLDKKFGDYAFLRIVVAAAHDYKQLSNPQVSAQAYVAIQAKKCLEDEAFGRSTEARGRQIRLEMQKGSWLRRAIAASYQAPVSATSGNSNCATH